MADKQNCIISTEPTSYRKTITREHLALVVFSHCITLPQNEFAHRIHSRTVNRGNRTEVEKSTNPYKKRKRGTYNHQNGSTFSGSSESGGPRSLLELSQVFFITSHWVTFDCNPPPPPPPLHPKSPPTTLRISPFEVKVASLQHLIKCFK